MLDGFPKMLSKTIYTYCIWTLILNGFTIRILWGIFDENKFYTCNIALNCFLVIIVGKAGKDCSENLRQDYYFQLLI